LCEVNRFSQLAQGFPHNTKQEFIRLVVGQTELPIILDADGLNAFEGMADTLNGRNSSAMVLTPHPGEMARLLGITVKEVQARRLDVALEAAGRWRAHVILRGFHTILATPSGYAYINTTGNPGMATGGTGDVLTGILAGLTAQFGVEDWARVLSLGVYIHGLAGDIAASRVGEAPLIASRPGRALRSVLRSRGVEAVRQGSEQVWQPWVSNGFVAPAFRRASDSSTCRLKAGAQARAITTRL
jgi:NAD(P)H-hydrate epimerase